MGANISRPVTEGHRNHPSSVGDEPPTLKDFTGSDDESFYDAQSWLESDGDDDFYSFDGDYSPSCVDTPAYTKITEDKQRKKLLELFRLSRGGFADENFLSVNTSTDVNIVSTVVTSVSSSERSSKASIKHRRKKSLRLVHPIGCFPKLLTARHKNGKSMDASSVSEEGRESAGYVIEV